MRIFFFALLTISLTADPIAAAPAASKSHFTVENLSNVMLKIEIFPADDYFGTSTPDQFGLAALSQRSFTCPNRGRYACRIGITAKQVPICTDLRAADPHTALRLNDDAILTVMRVRSGGFLCEISQP